MRNSSTTAPGAALPAMTASPVGSMRAMSKTGTDSSVSGERGDTTGVAATAFASACAVASAVEPSSRSSDARGETAGAAVAAVVSIGGSRHTCVMPKTSAAPHAATSARDGTTIRLIDVAVMTRDRGSLAQPSRAEPAPICSGHQVRLTGIPSVSRADQCRSRSTRTLGPEATAHVAMSASGNGAPRAQYGVRRRRPCHSPTTRMSQSGRC